MQDYTIELSGGTDVGLIRPHNEDDYLVSDLGEYGALLGVADGMGGANAGEIASALTIETLKRKFTPEFLEEVTRNDDGILSFMEVVVKDANLTIVNHSKADNSTRGMGTTIVMAWIINGKAYVCWCGDSRCYVFNQQNGLTLLSHDHSLVQELVDKGKLAPELMHGHPMSNIITRCLCDTEQACPDMRTYQLHDGDTLMLCSDGLCGLCQDNLILETMTAHQENLTECKDKLIALALSAGGYDNVTVALAKVSFQTK